MTMSGVLMAGAGVAAAGATLDLAVLTSRRRADPARGAARRTTMVLRALAGHLGVPAPADLADRVAAAGSPAGLDLATVMVLKWALAVAAGAFGLAVLLAGPTRSGALTLLLAAPAGFLAPDLVLARSARRRRASVQEAAPDLLDRLRLAVEAGVSPARALAQAAARGDDVLAAELRVFALAVELGDARAQALAELCRCVPAPEVAALAALLRRADRHGVPLAAPLASLADGLREDQARALRERAATSAPKIQLIVALLLVPAALLVVGAGLLAGLR